MGRGKVIAQHLPLGMTFKLMPGKPVLLISPVDDITDMALGQLEAIIRGSRDDISLIV